MDAEQMSPAQQVAVLDAAARAAFFDGLDGDEFVALRYLWRGWWARPNQLLPPLGDWQTWLIMAGRGWGKSLSAAQAVRELVNVHGYRNIGLIGRTAADVRDVMVEGPTGLLSVFPPWAAPRYEPSKRRLTFPNGAVATTFSADQPEQLRGPQHDAIWCDELAAWRDPDTWDQAQFGLRLGAHPLAIVSTTPRPTPLLRDLLLNSAPDPTPGVPVVVTVGRTMENAANLPPSALRYLLDKYAGTRLGRQELDAELLLDTPGALWTLDVIEANRVTSHDLPDALLRVVVAVDPPASDRREHASRAEAGIVVAGLAADGHVYVLEDASIGGSPAEWAHAAIAAYDRHDADVLVAEVNNGGEMVAYTVRSVAEGAGPNIKQVRASRGKHARAEPISAFYARDLVHHVGAFAQLEDQMCTWVPGAPSPDRLDALVWAITELLLNQTDAPLPARHMKLRRLGRR